MSANKNLTDIHSKNPGMTRRQMLTRTAVAAAATVAAIPVRADEPAKCERIVKNGRINQSVSRWCYNDWSLDKLCAVSAKMGIKSVELLNPPELPTVKKHGLVCAMLFSHSLQDGLSHTENHPECLAKLRENVDAASEYGFPNVVCFSGNRKGLPDDVGIENTVTAIKQIIGYAEKKNVTLCIEYLNSKVNHKDYMFDKMSWGVEVCKKVGSERMKILYDIYHAQIMEGDIIRTIRDNHQYISHYHTGGNPGRNEIDETQELYYPAIMKAILETGYKGYVGQEFVPTRDPLTSLAQAIEICDV
ncbi:MAG: TIM barrel protein [Sedimentisphaerales bacterium]|nr:TIM barrel protein [Sedimentisphaerales bacterium]